MPTQHYTETVESVARFFIQTWHPLDSTPNQNNLISNQNILIANIAYSCSYSCYKSMQISLHPPKDILHLFAWLLWSDLCILISPQG